MGIDTVLPSMPRDSFPVVCLSMDGGGIRSLLSVYALNFIEKELKRPTNEIFDIIVASSTSSLVAAGLTIPDEERNNMPMYEAEDLVHIFKESLPEIFVPMRDVDPYTTRPRYNLQRLVEFFKVFYPGQFGSSLTNLILPVVNQYSRRLFSFKSWEDLGEPMEYAEVLRASCATPNYFPPVNLKIADKRHRLVDGSLHFYNPTGQAVIAAHGLYPWKFQVHLSLGSGLIDELRSPFVQRTPISPVWGSPFLDWKIRFEAEGFHNQMASFLGANYTKIQIDLNKEEEALLDDFHEATQFIPSTVSIFEEVGRRYVDKNREDLLKFCNIVKGLQKIDSNAQPIFGGLNEIDYGYLRICQNWPTPEQLGIEPEDKEAVDELKEYVTSLAFSQKNKQRKARDKFQFLITKERPFYKEMKKYMGILDYQNR